MVLEKWYIEKKNRYMSFLQGRYFFPALTITESFRNKLAKYYRANQYRNFQCGTGKA